VLHLGARTPWSLRGPRVVVAEEVRTAVRPWRQGFVTDALDPEAPIMLLSLLARFVPAGGSVRDWTPLLALLIVAPALVWFPAVALFVDRLGLWLRRPRCRDGQPAPH
jgi:threonine/homoserine/homoserine lactone efflux protein